MEGYDFFIHKMWFPYIMQPKNVIFKLHLGVDQSVLCQKKGVKPWGFFFLFFLSTIFQTALFQPHTF